MGRATRWSRMMLAALLPLLLLGVTLFSARPAAAVGCGDPPELAAPAVQAQERWRYIYDGGGSYQIVGWTPTEVTLLVNSPGCAISHIALVGLDLIGGTEMWRVTYDQLQGEITDAATYSGLALLVTSDAVSAYDETTGAQLWSVAHGFEGWPEIVAIENTTLVLSVDNSLTGVSIGTGAIAWQQRLPVSSVSDWENISGGPLVALGRPETEGADAQAFGIDKATGTLLWQTAVGQTATSTGGTLNLAGNGSGLIAAEVLTDATIALVALDGTNGAALWSAPLANDGAYGRMYVTKGEQPAVIYATGGALEVKSATGYDAATGAVRWQNENIGADAMLADDTHLVGAGPTLSYLNALVMVDGETGEMVWAQHEALVDGSFSGSAQVFIGELTFAPSLQEEPAPTVTAVDLATGAVNWSSSYPEFTGLYIVGQAAGIVLATGDTADEAVLMGLDS
jgi:outer membrane protein assembly factor BamB